MFDMAGVSVLQGLGSHWFLEEDIWEMVCYRGIVRVPFATHSILLDSF